MSTRHSIDFCPVCGGGLCSIRYFDAASATQPEPHGLIICDECEAIWLEPDLTEPPIYADPETPCSPVTGQPLWGNQSRWATMPEIERLGWATKTDRKLEIKTTD